MATRRWLLVAIALAGGCAHRMAAIDESVAALPAGERQRVVSMQQRVDAAQSNVASARVARDEAQQLLRVADRQLRAARARLDAAKDALNLALRANDPAAMDAAERELRAAEQQVIAQRLQRDYADRLVALRTAELREREAEVDVARADLDAYRLAALNRYGIAGEPTPPSFGDEPRRARDELARRQQRVAELRGETANLRAAWEQQRRAVATRPTTEPLPPRQAPTDVNEGPAAPQSVPNQNFAQ